jgi:hypothetical protein
LFTIVLSQLQVFQSSWHGTCGWIGWFRIVSKRISCCMYSDEILYIFLVGIGWFGHEGVSL